MALRLVRETSATPNITNKDDVRMIRYGYGGYNGFVKNYGSELDYEKTTNTLRLKSGRIVYQGWEIDVDEAGWIFDSFNTQGVQYNTIYLEIDVSIESIEIKSTFLTGQYPIVDEGDDLTKSPNGKARFALYNVKVENGIITEVIKKVEVVPYLPDVELKIDKKFTSLATSLVTGAMVVKKAEIAQYATSDTSKGTIEDRLTKLGFKSGVISFAGVNYGSEDNKDTSLNGIYRQGNYVFGQIKVTRELSNSLLASYFGERDTVLTLPENFRPAKDTSITLFATSSTYRGGLVATINKDTGKAVVNTTFMQNLTGETSAITINFGFEAPPIK